MNVSVLFLIGGCGLVGLLAMCLDRSGRWLGSLLLVLAVGSAGFILWRSASYAKGFASIDIGATSEHVRAKVGTPDVETDCSTSFGGGPGIPPTPARAACATEYWYYAVWAPEAWSFAFDSQGVLIDKYHWVSP